jgi:hypothetical protein
MFRILFLQGFLIHPSYKKEKDFGINSTFISDFLVYLGLLNGDKMDLEGLGTFKEHEGHALIHLVQIQEEPNSCGTMG